MSSDIDFKKMFEKRGGGITFKEGEKERILYEYETNYFPEIDYGFFNIHNGLKNGKKHLILSQTGKGKTTLARSILFKAIEKRRVLWFSTEEAEDLFKLFLIKSGVNHSYFKNIVFLKENESDPFPQIKKKVIENDCEIVFFDNLTTSRHYCSDGTIKMAQKFFNEYERMIEDINVPQLILAHTDKNRKEGNFSPIDPNDIRGWKHISNVCEFIYALESFRMNKIDTEITNFNFESPAIKNILRINFDQADNGILKNIVKILKSRTSSSGEYYLMSYNAKTKIYESAVRLSNQQYQGLIARAKEYYNPIGKKR